MDHPCEKCEHPVEDGIPFCSHCRAPQIRVMLPDAEPVALAASHPDAPPAAIRSNRIQWSLALPVCALAGILSGAAMAVTSPAILWMLAAGFLSVSFYHRRNPANPPSLRIGMRLGGASGVFAMAVFFSAAVYNGLLREMLSQTLNFYATMKADPRFQDIASRSVESLKRPGGLSAWLFSMCLVMVIFFAMGGALAGAFLRRRERK